MANSLVAKSQQAANVANDVGRSGLTAPGEDEDEPEETKAVQPGDRALRFDMLRRLEPRPNVGAEAEQPRDVTQNEKHPEKNLWRHGDCFQAWLDVASNTAVRIPSRPSMKLRPRLAESCAKSDPITALSFGEGAGPDARRLRDLGLGRLAVVLREARAEAFRLDRLPRGEALTYKNAAGLQHPPDFAVEPRAIGDVHRHMLQEHGVETPIVERKF